MNSIKKHYMRMRYQERVDALKKAGIPVTQKTVYDESIHVGVPVPRFGKEKHTGRRQADHEVNKKGSARPFYHFFEINFLGCWINHPQIIIVAISDVIMVNIWQKNIWQNARIYLVARFRKSKSCHRITLKNKPWLG